MPRARTGTLVPPGADGLWRCRVTKDKPDGTTWRPLYTLGTADKALAKRKLARVNELLAQGVDPFEAAEIVSAPDSVKEYADGWLKAREEQGIASVKRERFWLTDYALGAIGRMPMCDVRPSHIRSILDDALAKGLKRNSLASIRGVLHRMFRSALEAEAIEVNPVTAARTPKTREVHKERCILTDEEFSKFIACPLVGLELRMLALVARCEGGMRTGDLRGWDWTMIDRVHFAECFIPRAKTRKPQRLAIPPVLAPFLRAWHERAGQPESGPVFPVTRGKRAGQPRSPNGLSFAKRLRRELFLAGVYRAKPIEVPATSAGTRTDLGHEAKGTKLAPNPADPLYFETATTMPVDFHSFRRAFASALAEAGVNVQRAMHLAAHSDPRVHERYVMQTTTMRQIPSAALPSLPRRALAVVARRAGIVTARDESSRRGVRGRAQRRDSLEPTIGLEPMTYALRSGSEEQQRESLQALAPVEGAEGADRDPVCFPVSPDDSSRIVTDERAECTAPADVVEAALARAVEAELAERRPGWEARVASLADELRARRLSREGVPDLKARTRRRGA